MSLFWGCSMVIGCIPKNFFWYIRTVVFKLINQGISEANQYESDPYPRACLSCCVMCCGLKVCAFLTKFLPLLFSFVNSESFLIFNSFPQDITCKVRKPLFRNHKFLESMFPFILVHITIRSCIQQYLKLFVNTD
jgi:hypothetical protein